MQRIQDFDSERARSAGTEKRPSLYGRSYQSSSVVRKRNESQTLSLTGMRSCSTTTATTTPRQAGYYAMTLTLRSKSALG